MRVGSRRREERKMPRPLVRSAGLAAAAAIGAIAADAVAGATVLRSADAVAGATVLRSADAVAGATVLRSAPAFDRADSAAATPAPPATVTGGLIRSQPRTVKVGTRVPPTGIGQRVFVNGKDGFALGGVGQAQYPAATTDGGATWKTTGPALHLNAAQAPLAVTTVGVASRRTYFYYGAGTVVDSTSDGGKHWYRAFLGDFVLAVVPGANGQLVAIAQKATGAGNRAVTWVYMSRNGGKLWRYDPNLGGF
jgi:hypothetical protein